MLKKVVVFLALPAVAFAASRGVVAELFTTHI